MTERDPVQCPVCGWTGHPGDLDGTGDETACPTCGEGIDAVV